LAGIGIVALGAMAAPLTASHGAAAEDTHVVQYGDTLSHLALRYGMTVEDLAALNGIDDPDLIVTGELLQLDGSGTATTHASAADTEQDILEGGPAVDWSTDVAAASWETELPPYFEPEVVQSLLVDAAERYGWDPYLIMAQAWQESYWRQDEVSWTGAVGVMQVMPATAAELEAWYFGYELNTWYSAYDNIEAGVAYLTILYEETGSVELALASYYQGWGSVQRDGFFPDTDEYVQRIFMFREQFASGELP
jgi:hypothetical protein